MPEETLKPNRKRPHQSFTIAERTKEDLAYLSAHFTLSRNRIIDLLVQTLATSVRTSTYRCISGTFCQYQKQGEIQIH